jgi:3-oxoacyl-[acyl-carrier-protein] synthase II
MKKRVVITGTGMVTPLGNDTKTTWNGLLAGKSGIDYIKNFDVSGFRSRAGGEIKNFSSGHLQHKFKTGNIIEKVSEYGHLLAAADEAMGDADIPCGGDEMLCLGSGAAGDLPFSQKAQLLKQYTSLSSSNADRFVQQGQSVYHDFLSVAREHNRPAFFLNRLLGLSSVPKDIHVACATGVQVVSAGYDLIMEGRASRVICCTIQSLDLWKYIAFYLLGTLGYYDGPPSQASRPFDRKRNGLVIAEGSAVVILEDMEQAIQRKAPNIYAEIAGYGLTADAYRLTDPHPEGIHSAEAMRSALKHSEIEPEAVDYINAHGTSTVENDRLETKAIKDVFGEKSYDLLVNATKSMTGHMLVTSGLVETIVTALSLHEGRLHPTINLEEPDDECDLNYLAGDQPVEAPIQTAMTNSFGFGGHNISMVLKKVV